MRRYAFDAGRPRMWNDPRLPASENLHKNNISHRKK